MILHKPPFRENPLEQGLLGFSSTDPWGFAVEETLARVDRQKRMVDESWNKDAPV